jgi:ATP-binding cassette subfamily F protein 3
VLSGGERIRLAFLRLFLAPPNLLLLDAPTTHLDLDGRRTLEKLLQAYDGTLCLVSHDVAFVRAVANGILEISAAGVRRFPGGYDYYREKIAAENNAAPRADAARAPTDASADEAPADVAGALNSKELRRARAQVRAQHQRALRDLRRRVEDYEAHIAKLEEEQKALMDELSSGAPNLDYAGKSARLKNAQVELGRYSAAWEEAAGELERLEKELAAAQAAIA